MKVTAFILMSFIVSCSSNRTKQDAEVVKIQTPAWVTEPSLNCPIGHLCASAEGSSFEKSDELAKAQIASAIKTQVSYQFESTLATEEKNNKSDSDEFSKRVVKANSEMILNGAEISQRYDQAPKFYSFAQLDKKKFAAQVEAQLKQTEDEITHLLEKKDRTMMKKASGFYQKQQELNSLYLSLVNTNYPTKVKLEDLKRLKESPNVQRKRIFFSGVDAKNRGMAEFLKAYLASVGHKFVTSDYDRKINFNLSTEKQYLNVDGFVKLSYHVDVKSYNASSEKIGQISFQETCIGRTEQDCFSQVEGLIKNKIEDNIEDLNL